MKTMFHLAFTVLVALILLSLAVGTVQGQKARPAVAVDTDASKQPLYSDYKGVRLGMTDQEVRAKLGPPTSTIDEQDFYVVSENETAQIAYDKSRKAVTISIDYLSGVGAPDNKAVVGEDLEERANGSLYKMVWYKKLGFWISYNRTTGQHYIVTVTLQKIT